MQPEKAKNCCCPKRERGSSSFLVCQIDGLDFCVFGNIFPEKAGSYHSIKDYELAFFGQHEVNVG